MMDTRVFLAAILGSAAAKSVHSETMVLAQEQIVSPDGDKAMTKKTVPCADSATYISHGYNCAAWTGYPCSSAASYGYTAAEVATLESSCPVTCGTCAAIVASPPPPTVLLPFGQTTSCPPWCNAYTTTNPLCFGCDATGAPATPAAAATPAPCANDPSYISHGYNCAAWTGYPCTDAATVYSYSATDQAALLSSCPVTCGTCPASDFKRKLGAVAAKAVKKETCADSATYTSHGYNCAAWTGYACSSASAYGYTAAEVATLESSCPITCGTPCAAIVASPPPPTVLLPFGQTTSCPPWCNAYTTTNALCFGCDATGAPATPAAAATPAPCVDSTTYISHGYTCAAWAGYPCSSAASYGYTATEVATLSSSCPVTCGTCPATSLDAKLDLLLAKISKLA